MQNEDAKLVQTVVLLDRQYLLTQHLVAMHSHVLNDFEVALKEQRQALNHILDVYNYVFALIDHLVRYEKIAYVLPRFNQKMAEFRAFSEAMGDLKDVRNQLQHINNDIENNYKGPLLGAVCWISGQQQFIASFHDIGRPRSTPGIFYNTQTNRYVHEFCYVYNEKYYDLRRAVEGARTFNEFIGSSVHIEIDGEPYESRDHFAALSITVGRFPEGKDALNTEQDGMQIDEMKKVS